MEPWDDGTLWSDGTGFEGLAIRLRALARDGMNLIEAMRIAFTSGFGLVGVTPSKALFDLRRALPASVTVVAETGELLDTAGVTLLDTAGQPLLDTTS